MTSTLRRRIVEVLADGERAAGEVVSVVQATFGVSQHAVSSSRRAA